MAQKATKIFLPGLRRNVSVAPLTTFGVGGRVAYYLPVADGPALIKAVKFFRRQMPYLILAGGSNVVFSDQIYPGAVIHFQPRSRGLTVSGRTIEAPANLLLSRLVAAAINHGLAGLESLTDIPGTVGGAIVGNAGAYGQTISDNLRRVQIFDGRGVRWLSRADGRFSYRESIFKKPRGKTWLVLAAEFKLKPGERRQLFRVARRLWRRRRKKYRPGLRCPGSFFKNVLWREVPPRARRLMDKSKVIEGKVPAGYLLAEVGARGRRRGGVGIASYHGNLLVNSGQARYRDVVWLARDLKKLVFKKFGIQLEEEIRYFGG